MIKNKCGSLFLVLATYFHFLVGGFWSLLLFGYSGVATSRLNKGLKVFVCYSLAILPIVVVLAFDQFSGESCGMSIDVI